MLTISLQPRFSETDALGHINNTVVPVWFETARVPVFEIFNPTQSLTKWNLILAKIEVNYVAQMSYNANVEIRTFVKRIGNSSLTLLQEVWQQDQKVAFGECVLVKFDYGTNQSCAISESEQYSLKKHIR
ncbi:acyl-CoA thioesterase [Psychrosphaera algicola]|uniref:Thioesterase family protein n=1 Tax=Psychrosphaera algicola TaxID=3023714 RepID=A0ABT5FH72_9GAMM|nr:thioesterase family protein [Psychrosphaera sp. G1-22]MDC2890546.1 thioesterase family protein [Psychrosphaera sp. G1-22]